jgi:3-oxoadipate enol-lactonase
MRVPRPRYSLYCLEEGDPSGLPVVFLHGFPFSHWIWRGQMKAVSGFCRAIAYDLAGHGQSDIGTGQYSIEGHVDDLIGVCDHLSLDRVVVVGLSMGGYVALRALERNPERFRGAVLCDTRSEADSMDAKLRRFAGVATVQADGSGVFADAFVKSIFAPSSFSRRKEEIAAIHQIISRTPPLSIAGTLLALAARTDTTPSLVNISVPVLILVGKEDAVTPPAAAEAMHERIRGSELQVIPNAGHLSNLENPSAFNHALVGFLRRIADGTPGSS